MPRRYRGPCALLVLLQALSYAAASVSTATYSPTQFAQLLRDIPDAGGKELIIQASTTLRVAAGLFASVQQSLGQDQKWRIIGRGATSSLDLRPYLSALSPAFIIVDGASLELRNLTLRLRGLQAAATEGFNPEAFLAGTGWTPAFQTNSGGLLQLSDINIILPPDEFAEYHKALCGAAWGFSEAVVWVDHATIRISHIQSASLTMHSVSIRADPSGWPAPAAFVGIAITPASSSSSSITSSSSSSTEGPGQADSTPAAAATPPQAPALACAAACIRSGGSMGGRELHAALRALSALHAAIIHISLAPPVVSLQGMLATPADATTDVPNAVANTADAAANASNTGVKGSTSSTSSWTWSSISLGSSTRLRLYGRPSNTTATASPVPPGSTFGSALAAAAQRLMDRPYTSDSAGAESYLGSDHSGFPSSVASGALLAANASSASAASAAAAVFTAVEAMQRSVLDVAGIRSALELGTLGVVDTRLLVTDLALVNLPYAAAPVALHGMSQAMMNWVDVGRQGGHMAMLGASSVTGLRFERCSVIVTRDEIAWWHNLALQCGSKPCSTTLDAEVESCSGLSRLANSSLAAQRTMWPTGSADINNSSSSGNLKLAASVVTKDIQSLCDCLQVVSSADARKQVVFANVTLLSADVYLVVTGAAEETAGAAQQQQEQEASHSAVAAVPKLVLDGVLGASALAGSSARSSQSSSSSSTASGGVDGSQLWLPLPSLLAQALPLLEPGLHRAWLPSLIFPGQHSTRHTWLVSRVYAVVTPSVSDVSKVSNKLGACGSHGRSIGSMLLTTHATKASSQWRRLEERASIRMYMRSQWVGNCSLGGLAETDELMSLADPRVSPFLGRPQLVFDFESYGTVFALQTSSWLYLQRITLVGLPALGWQMLKPSPSMDFCGTRFQHTDQWADPCPAAEPVAEDQLYTNMTLPLWSIGMSRMLDDMEQISTLAAAAGNPSGATGTSSSSSPTAQDVANATAQGRGPKLVLWQVALVIPCSELQLWHVLMLHEPRHGNAPLMDATVAGGSNNTERSSGGMGSEAVQPGVPLQLAPAGGAGSEQQQLLLLQRLRSFAAASQLYSRPGSSADDTIATLGQASSNNSSRSGESSNGSNTAAPVPLYFRRLVHWGWSGQWITLTCDAPSEGMAPEAQDALQQQLRLRMEYGVRVVHARPPQFLATTQPGSGNQSSSTGQDSSRSPGSLSAYINGTSQIAPAGDAARHGSKERVAFAVGLAVPLGLFVLTVAAYCTFVVHKWLAGNAACKGGKATPGSRHAGMTGSMQRTDSAHIQNSLLNHAMCILKYKAASAVKADYPDCTTESSFTGSSPGTAEGLPAGHTWPYPCGPPAMVWPGGEGSTDSSGGTYSTQSTPAWLADFANSAVQLQQSAPHGSLSFPAVRLVADESALSFPAVQLDLYGGLPDVVKHGSSGGSPMLHEHAGYACSSTASNTTAITSIRQRGHGIADGLGGVSAVAQLAAEQQHLRPRHARAQGCMDMHHGMRTAVEMLQARILAWQATTEVHDRGLTPQSADLSPEGSSPVPAEEVDPSSQRVTASLDDEEQRQRRQEHDHLLLEVHAPQAMRQERNVCHTGASRKRAASSQGPSDAATSDSGTARCGTADRVQRGIASASDTAAELDGTQGKRSDLVDRGLVSGSSSLAGHAEPLHVLGNRRCSLGSRPTPQPSRAAITSEAIDAIADSAVVMRSIVHRAVLDGSACALEPREPLILNELVVTQGGVSGAAVAAALEADRSAVHAAAQQMDARWPASYSTASNGTASATAAADAGQLQAKAAAEEAGRPANVPHASSSSICAAGSSTMLGALHVTGTPLWGGGGGTHGGSVYAGTWHGLAVAVKVLLLPALEGSHAQPPLRARARALREAALAVSLCHPHLLATLDVQLQPLSVVLRQQQQGQRAQGQQQGHAASASASAGCMAADAVMGDEASGVGAWQLCMVQELCNAGSLESALQEGLLSCATASPAAAALSGAEGATSASAGAAFGTPACLRSRSALELLAQVALGVSHLHARRIVHGDLCPANVLLTLLPPGEGLGDVHERLCYTGHQRGSVPVLHEDMGRPVGIRHPGHLCPAAPETPPPRGGGHPTATAAIGRQHSARGSQHNVDDSIIQDRTGMFAAASTSSAQCQAGSLEVLAHTRLWARVADFGLSSCLGPHQSHASGAGMGRYMQYMCPTLLAQGHASLATDTYAFGVMAREVLHAATATAGSSCYSHAANARPGQSSPAPGQPSPASIACMPAQATHDNLQSAPSSYDGVTLSPCLHALLDACMGDASSRPCMRKVADTLLGELTELGSMQ